MIATPPTQATVTLPMQWEAPTAAEVDEYAIKRAYWDRKAAYAADRDARRLRRRADGGATVALTRRRVEGPAAPDDPDGAGLWVAVQRYNRWPDPVALQACN